MNTLRIGVSLICIVIAGCQAVPKAELSRTAEPVSVPESNGIEFTADTSQSIIEWIGTKPVGKHHGTIKLESGKLLLNNGIVSGGNFVMDINSLEPDDKKAKSNATLREHLLSDDFFDVIKFPYAVFVITDVKEVREKTGMYTVTGNLQLKEITKSISFPANITLKESKIEAFANFNIDRTAWNMNYGNDKSLGNWFINPVVNIRLYLVANRNL